MACMLLTRRAGVALHGAGAAAYGAFSQDEIESIARYWRPDGKYGCICSASDVNPHTTMFTASGALACDVTPFNWILRDISTTKSGALRKIPIRISKAYSSLASRSKKWAFIFLAVVFVVIPAIGLIITEVFIYN